MLLQLQLISSDSSAMSFGQLYPCGKQKGDTLEMVSQGGARLRRMSALHSRYWKSCFLPDTSRHRNDHRAITSIIYDPVWAHLG